MEIIRPQSNQPMPEHAKIVFKGKIFDVYQWEQEMFDGTTVTFEKIKRPDTVVVFPVLDDGRILLADQEQPGEVPYISAFGGRVNQGEDILEAAKRELFEETGYEAGELILWKAQQVEPKIDRVFFIFIGKKLVKTGTGGMESSGEKISFKPVTFDELLLLGLDQKFGEKEVVFDLLEAQINPAKRKELEDLFKPIV